jgi:ABC-type phosphate transport system substrate-binding protein
MNRYPFISALILVLATSQGTAAFANDVGYVVIVSVGSPVVHLAAHEVANMYLGRTGRFPDGRLVVPVDLKESNAARKAFYKNLIQQNPAQIQAQWSRLVFTGRGKPPRQASNGIELVEIVARNPNAIGYVKPEFVNDSVRIVHVDP